MNWRDYVYTYAKEQCHSWETNRFLAIQGIPRILWNPKVQYSPPPVPILSHINPLHVPNSTSWRSILLLYFCLCPCLPSRLIHSGFLTKPVHTFPLPIQASSLAISFISNPDLYRLFTFQVPSLMKLFPVLWFYQRINPSLR